MDDADDGGRWRTMVYDDHRPPKSSFLSNKMRFFTMADDADDDFRILLYLREKKERRKYRPAATSGAKLRSEIGEKIVIQKDFETSRAAQIRALKSMDEKPRANLKKESDIMSNIESKILERDNYQCQFCELTHDQLKFCYGIFEQLKVCHIDGNKQNNQPENLVTLCFTCFCESFFVDSPVHKKIAQGKRQQIA